MPDRRTAPKAAGSTAHRRRTAAVKRRALPAPLEHRPMMAELYRRAEARLRSQQKLRSAKSGPVKPAAGPPRLQHELEVHQIELELQNAELQKARDELEVSLEKSTDLYDFAPVGYFSLDETGRIGEVNLTGAALLGVERSRLRHQSFVNFVTRASQPEYQEFLKRVLAGSAKLICKAALHNEETGDFWARIIGVAAISGGTGQKHCRLAVWDISSLVLAEVTQARLAAIVEFSEDAIIGKDLHSVVTNWNRAAEKIFGYPADEMVGQSILRLIPADRQAEEQHILARIRRGESVQHLETLRQTKAGKLIDVSLTISPIKDAGDKVVGVSQVARNISERKRAEASVRVSEIRYRRLFEAAHDGVLLLDPVTSKITDANPFMTRLLGYPRAALVGKELFEIGLLRDEAASREMFRKLKRNHEVRYEDLPLESQDGRHQEVEVVANLYVENGHSVIQCNIRDITERKRVEEILRRNAAIFSALVAQAPVGVYVVDARFRLQQVNPRARAVFGKVHRLIGRDFAELARVLWPQRAAEQVIQRFRHTLKTGVSYESPEFAERRRDTGRAEVYEWQIQRITLPAGELGVVCFFNNITERKQAENAQRRLDILTASNLKLQQEITRREAVELALLESKVQQDRMLSQSQILQAQMQQLSHQILHAQEEERKRISRELHDEIAQTLVGINVHLAALTRRGANAPGKLMAMIARTRKLVEKSVEIVHRFAWELRPTALDDLGLIPALQSFMKEFTQRTGVRTHLTAFAAIEKLNTDKRTVLYRVAHEALNNVAHHARASRVHVTIEKLPDWICMKIKDDGKAFNAEQVLAARGNHRMGLLGMRERLEMVGGNFLIDSVPGKGTTIRAQIPHGVKSRGGGRRARVVR